MSNLFHNEEEYSIEINHNLNEFLRGSIEDIYEIILYSHRPIVSARNYLKKWRKESYLRGMENLFKLSEREKEIFLKTMIDLVSFKHNEFVDIERIGKELEENFSKEKKIGKTFEKFATNFQRLNQREQLVIIKKALRESSIKIHGMRVKLEEKSFSINGYDSFVISQLLYILEKLIDKLLLLDKFTPESALLINSISMELLRILALKEGKLTIDDIYYDIINLSQYIEPKYPVEIDNRLIKSLEI
ncbi:hypothetical protein [Candidatus Pyrohabitans sp.]